MMLVAMYPLDMKPQCCLPASALALGSIDMWILVSAVPLNDICALDCRECCEFGSNIGIYANELPLPESLLPEEAAQGQECY